jgi:hypothetical protein
MNWLRMDMFEAFTMGSESAELNRDMARLVNILTGRGDGATAQALSGKKFGIALYAPRFMYSTFQNAYLPFLLPTFKTTAGKVAAMKAWGKQVGAIWASYELAKVVFGDENVDTDIRSANFGQIVTPWVTINPIGKLAQPYTFPVQFAMGRISQPSPKTGKSNVVEPGYGSPAIAGRFFMNKMSPIMRVGTNQLIGEKFNYQKWESEPFTVFSSQGALDTAKESFVPLAVQQAMEGDLPEDWSHYLFSILGMSSTPKGKTKKVTREVPMERELPRQFSEAIQRARSKIREQVKPR